MLYANNLKGDKITPNKSEKGLCPICKGIVIPKMGDIKVHHWAHIANKDCDDWSEYETEWHIGWKSAFPKENVEALILKNNKYHRADVLGSDGTVIEFQHSPINQITISIRESFYDKMIWVFDVTERRDGFHREDFQFFSGEYQDLIGFKFNHGRPSYLFCTRPLYFDYSMTKMLKVELLTPDNYGLGKFIEKTNFISKYS
jgi:competence CoiA-like predicted nuclease